jgi:hypothetical protein
VGTLTSLTVSGNVTANNVTVTGQFSGPATGLTNIPTPQLTVKRITVVAGTGLTGGGNVDLGGSVTLNNSGVTGATGTANQVLVNQATGNVTYSLPQNIHTGANPQFNSVLVALVGKTGTNGTGDIGQSTNRFGNVWATTFSGTSVAARYADLAEIYMPDQDYAPGTVVVFGGTAEITTTSTHADVSVAGVISTNPAYLMNAETSGLPVALRGRVPVRVIGPVQKGDLLVTSVEPGVAVSVGKDPTLTIAVFAKALEHKTSDHVGVIEAVII